MLLGGFLLMGRTQRLSAAERPPVGPVTVQDVAMLSVPAELAGRSDFVVAKTPPRITFSMVRGLEPIPAGGAGLWTNLGEGVCAKNGKFYVAFSNNASFDGNCCLYEYDPLSSGQKCVLDMGRFLGQRPGEFPEFRIGTPDQRKRL